MAVGVLAIQGDFEKHISVFEQLGVQAREVRTEEDLSQVDRLVIPGGESTTVGKLLQRFGLGELIIKRVKAGMPIWGTCMGMIMLATEIEGCEQYSLELLDITVKRNAFGRQVHSFEDEVEISSFDEPVRGVFIRAPIVSRVGEGVEVIAEYENKVVGVRCGSIVGTSFHPELTDDARFHEWFLTL
ncbi:MAG TPA: pyridoxal 5'-phosphate synthase glutaminase subunit PdxT [Fimbriimonas sp.]|nr:pyridoxal 5'-phosphate synthase glutaminase subunit PdxT [Fimbriimonas sp.]